MLCREAHAFIRIEQGRQEGKRKRKEEKSVEKGCGKTNRIGPSSRSGHFVKQVESDNTHAPPLPVPSCLPLPPNARVRGLHACVAFPAQKTPMHIHTYTYNPNLIKEVSFARKQSAKTPEPSTSSQKVGPLLALALAKRKSRKEEEEKSQCKHPIKLPLFNDGSPDSLAWPEMSLHQSDRSPAFYRA